ncbi:MAG: indole-3-glycerol phosphate synthase TrpC [Brachybacterium sp.]|nr:indole-3-glycerol phosphate synthase TrpC [Brachybacterium sp.]
MPSTGTVLDAIITGVREDVEERRARTGARELEHRAAGRTAALDAAAVLRADTSTLGLIAEVKRASPSKGHLADIPDPAALAAIYAEAGANVISVLTERRRFRGSLDDLDAVRARVDIPVLRKDFIVDPYQVLEARAHGADLVLLIVAALEDAQLAELAAQIDALGMQALVEVHDLAELERAVHLTTPLIGVNARDLTTLEVHPDRAAAVLREVPADRLAIGESAVADREDAEAYADAGADAVLVGEALVTGADTPATVRSFRSVPRRGRPHDTATGGTP